MNPSYFWRHFEDEWFTPKYHLKKLLGAGSFGCVFLADEVIIDRAIREVAIKIFSDDREQKERQIAELQIAISLKHPGLLESFSPEQGWLKGTEYLGLVMELAQDSLAKRLRQESLPLSEVKLIVKNLASALNYLHNKGIVHRDLKPANIMQVDGQWKLTDFGISRFLENYHVSDTSPTNQLGTIAYAPPESYSGKISLAWDLWSLGIVIVEILTGKHPFAGTTPQEMMYKVTTEEPNISIELPTPFSSIIQGCLIKNYTQRWTANKVLTALDPTADLGRVTVLLPLSPSFRKVIPTAEGATGCVSIPVARIEMREQEAFNKNAEEVGFIPEERREKIRIPNRQSDYQERLIGGSIIEMVAIPMGSFLMGTSTEDIEKVLGLETWFRRSEVAKWLRTEMPQHRVTIPEFYMSRTPITQEQWQAVMQTNPSHFSALRRPVESISWWDAVEFCDRLSEMTNKCYRLPTEAEWEYACRANTRTLYNFGNSKQPLRDYAWYTWNSRHQTQPVGQKKPNAWGLQDMHGLVWEWCEDDWHENYNGAPNDGSAWIEDGHPTKRVVRGGSWYSLADDCRSVYRFCFDASFRYPSIGLRVVVS